MEFGDIINLIILLLFAFSGVISIFLKKIVSKNKSEISEAFDVNIGGEDNIRERTELSNVHSIKNVDKDIKRNKSKENFNKQNIVDQKVNIKKDVNEDLITDSTKLEIPIKKAVIYSEILNRKYF